MRKMYSVFLKILVAFFLIYLPFQGFAGEWYYKVGGAYNISAGQSLFGVNSYHTTVDSLNSFSYTYKEEAVYGSMGSGFSYGLSFGYKKNSNVAFETGMLYLQSNSYNTKSFYMRTFTGGNWYSRQWKNSVTGSSINFIPSLIINTQMYKFSPFLRMGLVFAISSRTDEHVGVEDSYRYGRYDIHSTESFSSGYSIGTVSAIGCTFPLSENVSFSGEFNMINLTTCFVESEITSFIVNDRNYLQYLTVSQKNTVFVENPSSGQGSLRSQPRKELLIPTPYNSYGFCISFIIKIQNNSIHPIPARLE
jgi:hypothetical protein